MFFNNKCTGRKSLAVFDLKGQINLLEEPVLWELLIHIDETRNSIERWPIIHYTLFFQIFQISDSGLCHFGLLYQHLRTFF